MAVEIQPIILAAGRGRKLYPFTEDGPKALLPVANKPLIYFPLQYLQNEGFTECTILISEVFKDAFKSCMADLHSSFGITIATQLLSIEDEDFGSVESLQSIKHHFKGDSILLLSCDLVCNVPLNELADVHRIQYSSLTLLVASSGPPGKMENFTDDERKKWTAVEQDIFGVDDQNRLLLLHREVFGEDELDLSRPMLKRHPRIRLHFGLSDAHMYLIKREVLEWSLTNIVSTSLYDEVIPEIIRRQFLRDKPSKESLIDCNTSSVVMFSSQNGEVNLERVALLASSYSSTGEGGILDNKERVRCYAYIADKEQLCLRVKTSSIYSEINKLIPRVYPSLIAPKSDTVIVPSPQANVRSKPQISSDSLVGNGINVSDRSSVKKSVIGHHCTIKDKSKIVGSVLMDHVIVEERATIQNCVLSHHVHIEEGTILKDCSVGPNVVISKGMEVKGETFVSSGLHI